MMKLLAAAGVPTLHEFATSMEHSGQISLATGDSAWMDKAEGKAVKLLDISKFPPPVGRKYRVIWMNRDPHEQAKSQLKFLDYLGFSGVTQDRQTVRRIAGSLKHARGIELATWRGRYRAPVLEISFEDLLAYRAAATMKVIGYLNLPARAQDAMLPLIVHRAPTNYPGLLEVALMGKDPNA